MKKSPIFALLAFLFLAVSCQKTIEGEMRNFESNIQKLNEVSAKYPNFKNVCDILRKDATDQMETAKKLAEESSKIKSMSAANEIISPSWISDLLDKDKKVNDIRDLITKVAQNVKDKNDSDAAWSASRQGEEAIREAKTKLENAVVNRPSDAEVIVRTEMSNLDAAIRRLNDVVKTAQDKVAAQKQAENDAKAAEDQKTAEEEKKKAPIKCGFCGNSSPAGTSKCNSCGASFK